MNKPTEIAWIGLDQFVEVASTSALRALEAVALNPQPLPPGSNRPTFNPHIWIGIVASLALPSFASQPGSLAGSPVEGAATGGKSR